MPTEKTTVEIESVPPQAAGAGFAGRLKHAALKVAGLKWLGLLIAVFVFVAVGLALRKLIGEVTYNEVVGAVAAMRPQTVLVAILATAGSYGFLTLYDVFALRYVGKPRRFLSVAYVSFIAYAVGNTAGFGPLSGGAVRYRFYTRMGLSPEEIAKVIAYVTAAFGIGLALYASVGMLFVGPMVASEIGMAPGVLRLIAAVVLVALFAAYAYARWWLRAGKSADAIPSPLLVAAQVLTSGADLACSAITLYLLLPNGAPAFPVFFAIYVVAIGAGILSHVPAGLGVVETIIVAAMPNLPADATLAALMIYRVIYHIGPLILAAVLVVFSESRALFGSPTAKRAISHGVNLAPFVLATLTFLAGGMLIFSSVTPTPGSDLKEIAGIVPMPLVFVETAHFVSGILGVFLLAASRGLSQRLDGAYWVVLTVSTMAAVLCFAKAVAVYEAVFLAFLVAALFATRHQFDRPASLTRNALSPQWLIAMAFVVIAAIGILFFVYENVPYTEGLWIEFELNSNAPRGLRALLGVVVASAAVSIWSLTRSGTRRIGPPNAAELNRAVAIAAQQDSCDAELVRSGDKSVIFSPNEDAFLMFAQHGRTWVSFLGPIGNPDTFNDLVWQFVELAREGGGRAVLYQVPPETLGICAEAGMRGIKLGETALVDLRDFSLKGSRRSALRQSVNRAEREGLSFELLGRDEIEPIYEEIKAISDEWLGTKNAREKRFSVGWFERDYVLAQPMAIVRLNGAIVAFANLLTTGTKAESSIDLMRFLPDAPRGAMEFCLIKLMLRLREEGHQSFNLGMAPLSGLARGPVAPLWNRAGQFVFENAEHFYNFQGIRTFKQKFDPDWQPRYLAVSGGLNPLLALADIGQLIAGGLKGIVSK